MSSSTNAASTAIELTKGNVNKVLSLSDKPFFFGDDGKDKDSDSTQQQAEGEPTDMFFFVSCSSGSRKGGGSSGDSQSHDQKAYFVTCPTSSVFDIKVSQIGGRTPFCQAVCQWSAKNSFNTLVDAIDSWGTSACEQLSEKLSCEVAYVGLTTVRKGNYNIKSKIPVGKRDADEEAGIPEELFMSVPIYDDGKNVTTKTPVIPYGTHDIRLVIQPTVMFLKYCGDDKYEAKLCTRVSEIHVGKGSLARAEKNRNEVPAKMTIKKLSKVKSVLLMNHAMTRVSSSDAGERPAKSRKITPSSAPSKSDAVVVADDSVDDETDLKNAKDSKWDVKSSK